MTPGIPTIMGFRRKGMQGAEPEFWDRSSADIDDRNGWAPGLYHPAHRVARLEVSYRSDVVALDTPDAEWIAAADPTTVLALLDRIRELEGLIGFDNGLAR